MTRCTIHRDRPAAWHCDGCGRELCLDCAAADERMKTLVRCVACGGVGHPLLVEPDRTPYWHLFPQLAGAIVSRNGLLDLLATGLTMYVVAWIPWVGALLALGALAGFFTFVVRRAALGSLELPRSDDFRDIDEGFFGPLLALVTALAVGWLPILAWVFAQGTPGMLGHPAQIAADPVLVLLLLVMVVYQPGALLVAAITSSALAVLNPLRVVALIARIPRQYALTIGVVIVLLVAQVLVVPLIARVPPFTGIPLLSGVLLATATLVLPTFLALVLGRLVYQNAPALGWDDPRGNLIPAVPGAVPRGVLPRGRAERGPAAGPAGAGPDFWDGIPLVAPEPARPPAGRTPDYAWSVTPEEPLGPAGRAAAQSPHAWRERLRAARPAPAAAAEADEPEWMELGAEEEAPAETAAPPAASEPAAAALSPAALVRLAQRLDQAGDHHAAIDACRRAEVTDGTGRIAPRAALAAAEILALRLNDREAAAAAFRAILERYAGDPAATAAAARLRELTDG